MKGAFVKLASFYTIIACLFIYSFSLLSYVEKDIVVLYQEKRIDDILFSERIQATDGIKKYTYTVNNATVNYEEYLDSLLQAESKERKKEYEYDHNIKVSLADTYCKARTKIAQQGLKKQLSDIEHDLKKVQENRLKHYWVFNQDTFSSKDEYLELINDIIPEAQDFCEAPLSEINQQKLNNYYDKVLFYKPRVKAFLAATLNNVVENSDDTKMLKEILDFIV